jgi:serine/threonine protein phosphatase PrpC
VNSIDYAMSTHTGLVRELNEDSHLATPELGLWIIADGMGGHDAGEVASGIAIREIAQSIRQGLPLTEAIESAHQAIQTAAQQHGETVDMGSTVVAVKLNGRMYEIAWVGDSRAYLWNGALRQLTTDHSYVQLMLNAGMITEDEIPNHPARNIISQGLGVGGLNGADIQVDSVSGELVENETLLLCSDGLNGEITDDCIAEILSETANNQARVDRLIQAALEAGGKDNVTVILLR